MRRAAKVDSNQSRIVAALRKIGASVQPLHAVGGGCPDLLVGFRGLNRVIEVKDGDKPPSARKLTPDQVEWHGAWRGQVDVAKDEDEAFAILGIGAATEARREP
ncbi:hypothetical protein [Tropicimonas sp. IMCC34011]|uniref:hypothetical protein n=1 Tax=Tropicimonas sp. IMCC34011 TaxID=2248759 RepID=UPI000E24C460|nr:hypothetical protein [Tropicimonas sp. IMCC34011]